MWSAVIEFGGNTYCMHARFACRSDSDRRLLVLDGLFCRWNHERGADLKGPFCLTPWNGLPLSLESERSSAISQKKGKIGLEISPIPIGG